MKTSTIWGKGRFHHCRRAALLLAADLKKMQGFDRLSPNGFEPVVL